MVAYLPRIQRSFALRRLRVEIYAREVGVETAHAGSFLLFNALLGRRTDSRSIAQVRKEHEKSEGTSTHIAHLEMHA